MATALSTDATLFLEDSDGNCTCLGYGDIKPEWRPLKIIDEEVLFRKMVGEKSRSIFAYYRTIILPAILFWRVA